MSAFVDILIPTDSRPPALAVTRTSLCGQTFRDFSVIISGQTETSHSVATAKVLAVLRVLRLHGHLVKVHQHLLRLL